MKFVATFWRMTRANKQTWARTMMDGYIIINVYTGQCFKHTHIRVLGK